LFFCTVTDFSATEKGGGVKFCTCVGLLSGQVFSHFGEFWLAESHGGGITSAMSIRIGSGHSNGYGSGYIEIAVGHSEFGAAVLLKAV